MHFWVVDPFYAMTVRANPALLTRPSIRISLMRLRTFQRTAKKNCRKIAVANNMCADAGGNRLFVPPENISSLIETEVFGARIPTESKSLIFAVQHDGI